MHLCQYLKCVVVHDTTVCPRLSPRYSLPDEELRGRLELTFFDSYAKAIAHNRDGEGGGGGGDMVRAQARTMTDAFQYTIRGLRLPTH